MEGIQLTKIELTKEDTFDSVYRAYYAPLCLFSSRYVDRKDAEDLVNALFMKLWDKCMTFDSQQYMQSYLYLSIKNACLDCIKTNGRRGERSLRYIKDSEHLESSFEQEIIQTEFWAEIYRQMNQLPPQCASVIKLSYIEGLSNEQIADELGLSLQTVKNHKSRGVKSLREWANNSNNTTFLLPFVLIFGIL